MTTSPGDAVEGGYVTRGRAAEIERQIADVEARLTARLYEVEQRLRAAESLPVDVLRAHLSALVDLIKSRQ